MSMKARPASPKQAEKRAITFQRGSRDTSAGGHDAPAPEAPPKILKNVFINVASSRTGTQTGSPTGDGQGLAKRRSEGGRDGKRTSPGKQAQKRSTEPDGHRESAGSAHGSPERKSVKSRGEALMSPQGRKQRKAADDPAGNLLYVAAKETSEKRVSSPTSPTKGKKRAKLAGPDAATGGRAIGAHLVSKASPGAGRQRPTTGGAKVSANARAAKEGAYLSEQESVRFNTQ